MKNNKKGFSLIIAMGLVIVISLIAYNILEYIIPFGKGVKSIENSSRSYYLANSGIEEGLYNVNLRNNNIDLTDKTEYSTGYLAGKHTTYKYNTNSSGSILPPKGEGNSEYNKDYNTISQGNPIQLSIGKNNVGNLDDFKINFKIPNLDKNNGDTDTETLSGGTLPIINWQLSSINDTLNASGSLITAENINDRDDNINDRDDNIYTEIIKDLSGVTLNGEPEDIETFYGDKCNSTGSGCTLKFSVVNKMETTDSVIIPYLEWQINLDSDDTIPLRYTKIESAGKSVGYKKTLEIKVPGNTVNQALDFTVFQ